MAQYGFGAFTTISRRGFEEKLPNFNAIATNQKNTWFSEEDKIISTDDTFIHEFGADTESVAEYAVGVWTRWLIGFPTTLQERAPLHTIFRFTNTREYNDKSELGNRVLSAFVGIGNYEFSTYDAATSAPAVDAKVPYT